MDYSLFLINESTKQIEEETVYVVKEMPEKGFCYVQFGFEYWENLQ